MASMTTNPIPRYSPKPLGEYVAEWRGQKFGPATSSLIDTPEAWNLAYLSHDYDTVLQPVDPFFTTNVRRTVQSRLDGAGADLTGGMPASALVQALLQMSAPRFVYLIQRHTHLKTLPMYLAYGDAWLQTIDRRAKKIGTPDYDYVPVDLKDLVDAKRILSKF